MESVKINKINKVKLIPCFDINRRNFGNTSDITEFAINDYLEDISNDHDTIIDDLNIITINNTEYIMIRYHYIEYTRNGFPVVPVRKYEIERIQTQIARMTEGIKDLLGTFSNKDDLKIEEFMIYEDFESRDRDHGIIIYSYNDYKLK